MNKITISFLFLLSALFSYGQEVTIGTGTFTDRFPFGADWGYERSAALYTAQEIAQTGFINQLAWDFSTTGEGARPVKIYLKETVLMTLPIASWSTYIAGAILVYEGTLDPSNEGFTSFLSSVSFPYSGGDNNLLVLVESNFGGTGGGDSYEVKGTEAFGRHFTISKDRTEPTEDLTEIFGSVRPNLKITFGDEIVCPFVSPTILRTSATSIIFTVTEGATMQSIDYEVRIEGGAGSGTTGLIASGTVTDFATLPVVVQ